MHFTVADPSLEPIEVEAFILASPASLSLFSDYFVTQKREVKMKVNFHVLAICCPGPKLMALAKR